MTIPNQMRVSEQTRLWGLFANVVIGLAILLAVLHIKSEVEQANTNLSALRSMAQSDAMLELEEEIEQENE